MSSTRKPSKGSRPSATSTDAKGGSPTPEVVFVRAGLTVAWDPRYSNLLELAEAHGLQPDHMCRVGACNTCLVRLLEGEVDYVRDLLVPPPPTEVLLCCSRPRTRIVVDV